MPILWRHICDVWVVKVFGYGNLVGFGIGGIAQCIAKLAASGERRQETENAP